MDHQATSLSVAENQHEVLMQLEAIIFASETAVSACTFERSVPKSI